VVPAEQARERAKFLIVLVRDPLRIPPRRTVALPIPDPVEQLVAIRKSRLEGYSSDILFRQQLDKDPAQVAGLSVSQQLPQRRKTIGPPLEQSWTSTPASAMHYQHLTRHSRS
jgi:hypothetical protein